MIPQLRARKIADSYIADRGARSAEISQPAAVLQFR